MRCIEPESGRGVRPAALLAVLLVVGMPALIAQDICPGNFCDDPIQAVCDPGGFRITLLDFDPAPEGDSGLASYTYQVCSPPEGVCSLDPNRTCLDNDHCAQFAAGACSRQCAVDSFRDLSHFDVGLPSLGGASCLSEDTQITGSCTQGSDSLPFSIGPDGACGGVFVAKCNASLEVGECYEMTVQIAGELNSPGLGGAFVVSKESTDCNESCIAGPSCEGCDDIPPDELQCLTRTAGFWGTHPHITSQFLPVTVCGELLSEVDAGFCDSATEAMCVSPGRESRGNRAYAQLVRQLTAAKLNLAATAANGGDCGIAIADRIAQCEALCGANHKTISNSGCVDDLAAFNESVDTVGVTPAPFDSPGPADSRACRSANGNGVVIGQGSCNQP